MPPKRGAGGETAGWSDEAKLEFVTRFFYSQVQGKLDWKTAPIPEGRTMNACNHLMRGLKTKYVANKDSEAGPSSPNKAKDSKAAKAKPACKKRKVAEMEAEHEDEDLLSQGGEDGIIKGEEE